MPYPIAPRLIVPFLVALAGFACQGVPAPAALPTSTLIPTQTSTLAPIPIPTPTLVPTSKLVPTPSAVAEPTNPAREKLAAIALGYLTELTENIGPRESATEQELAAAEYLLSQFADFGYSTQLQPFTVQTFSAEESGLTLEDLDSTRIEIRRLSGSATGEQSGILEPVGLARAEDIPEEGLAGKIALVERGQIRFSEKARNAGDAGAVGVVIFNNLPGNFQGTLGGATDIIVASISQEEGQRLLEMASDRQISARLAVKFQDNPSRNVVAEKAGTGPGIVVLGGHYDTVPDIVGANDNAAGTSVVLTLAQELSNKSFPFDLRFVAFGSEELGLLGSRFYVNSLSEEEQSRVVAMLNFDALAGGDTLRILGDRELTEPVAEQGQQRGINVEVRGRMVGSSSDHASFRNAGIPVIMFASDGSSQIHTAEDTLDRINTRLPGEAAQLALDLLSCLAETNQIINQLE